MGRVNIHVWTLHTSYKNRKLIKLREPHTFIPFKLQGSSVQNMGIFCCGGFGICCLVMKSLWTNTFAVLFSVLSPYPYTTAICLLPILFYLGNKFLIPMISRFWASPQSCPIEGSCCPTSQTDPQSETKKTL